MSFIKKNNISLRTDVAIVVLILVLPFTFFFYILAPDTAKVWNLMIFEIDAGYYEDVEAFLYIFFYKILTILLISIWFCTCKHWWRFFLLVPLFLEVHRFICFSYERFNDIEDYKIYFSILTCGFLYFLLFFITKRLKYYSSEKNMNLILNNEIYELMKGLSLIKSKNIQKVFKDYNILKSNKSKRTKKQYLRELVEIKNRL